MDMRKASVWTGFLAAVALAVSLVAPPAAAEEDATVRAFAAWQGQGQLFETGPKQVTFVGAFTGTMYIDTEKGPLASGSMVCPAVVTIDSDDGTQEGKGRCTITGQGGDRAYAEITCTGLHFIGCNGDFKLTGGTGRFAGISGGGPVNIRSEFGAIGTPSGTSAQEATTGILYLRELHYKIP
jgi:hypothetical protein